MFARILSDAKPNEFLFLACFCGDYTPTLMHPLLQRALTNHRTLLLLFTTASLNSLHHFYPIDSSVSILHFPLLEQPGFANHGHSLHAS